MPRDDDEARELGPVSRSDLALARIADALQCPIETFTDGVKAPLDVRGASELLTIWAEMDNDGDRARLLEFARKLVKPC